MVVSQAVVTAPHRFVLAVQLGGVVNPFPKALEGLFETGEKLREPRNSVPSRSKMAGWMAVLVGYAS